MRRDEALATLRHALPEMRRRFGVRSLRLFGSVARDMAQPDSDVDIVVEFDGPADFDRFMGLKLFIEDRLGVGVDLVTEKAIRPTLRPSIDREAVRVA
jgi:predicted nucleotidyltransferase